MVALQCSTSLLVAPVHSTYLFTDIPPLPGSGPFLPALAPFGMYLSTLLPNVIAASRKALNLKANAPIYKHRGTSLNVNIQ